MNKKGDIIIDMEVFFNLRQYNIFKPIWTNKQRKRLKKLVQDLPFRKKHLEIVISLGKNFKMKIAKNFTNSSYLDNINPVTKLNGDTL